MKKIGMPVQGEGVIRNSNRGYISGNVQLSSCTACCALSSNCPGCSCPSMGRF